MKGKMLSNFKKFLVISLCLIIQAPFLGSGLLYASEVDNQNLETTENIESTAENNNTTSDTDVTVDTSVTDYSSFSSETSSQNMMVMATSTLNSIVVNYVDETTGENIAPSYRALIESGSTWSATSPDISGYEISDISQATMTGVGGQDGKIATYVVKYHPIDTTYTIIHMMELDKGVYYQIDSEQRLALSNTTVEVMPKNYTGCTCITADCVVKVAPDGTSCIYLYYDHTDSLYTIYFYTEGSYVSSISGQEGDAIIPPADPTRAGYDFAGWSEAIPSTMPDHNMYINATWVPGEANYLVEYYKENPEKNGEYMLERTVAKTGLTGHRQEQQI